jgi:hypothetical protein
MAGVDEFHGAGGPLRVSNPPHIWPLAVILAVVSALALKRYQRTLD